MSLLPYRQEKTDKYSEKSNRLINFSFLFNSSIIPQKLSKKNPQIYVNLKTDD